MSSSSTESQQQEHETSFNSPQIKHQIGSLTTFGDSGIEIINDNDSYQVTDLHIKDRLGTVRQTISRTVLYPTAITDGELYENVNRHFHFIKGTGLIILHGYDWTEIREIQPESYLFVEKGTWHQITNTSKNEDMEYIVHHPGMLDRSNIGGIAQIQQKQKLQQQQQKTRKKV